MQYDSFQELNLLIIKGYTTSSMIKPLFSHTLGDIKELFRQEKTLLTRNCFEEKCFLICVMPLDKAMPKNLDNAAKINIRIT